MDEPVLVLNASYEPLSICSTRRAMGLLLEGKAILVLNGRGYIHTVSQSFPRPSVIRLREMVHRPRPRVKLSRREVFRRDHYTCQYCGRKDGRLTIDHIVPRHMGGQHSWNNVVTACETCNARKGGRTLEEAHMQLLHPPREPVATALYLFGHLLDQYQEWEPFLIGW